MPMPIIWAFYSVLLLVKNVQTVSAVTLPANPKMRNPFAKRKKMEQKNQIEVKIQLNMK
jgi:hypothetical protein